MIGPVEYLGWFCLDCKEDATVYHDADHYVVCIDEFFNHRHEMIDFIENNSNPSARELFEMLDERSM